MGEITKWKVRSTKDKLSTQAPQAILQLEKTGLSPTLAVADCPGAKADAD